MTQQETNSPKQESLLAGLSGRELELMKKALKDNLFWAVGIDTLCGGYSLGGSSMQGYENIPCLYATRDEAQAEIQEEQDRYAEEIADGDRDDDDEYEGELVAVHWDGVSDTLEIWDENNTFCMATQTVAAAMGE